MYKTGKKKKKNICSEKGNKMEQKENKDEKGKKSKRKKEKYNSSYLDCNDYSVFTVEEQVQCT